MVWTVLQVNLRRLMHNRVELMLTFVVPIAFFSIFALIFGSGIGGKSTPKIKVVAVDEIGSQASADVMASLRESAGLRFIRDQDDGEKPLDREHAQSMVQQGTLTMAIVLRSRTSDPDDTAEAIRADLLSDSSDQVASQVVTALVARAIMLARAEEQENEFSVFKPQAELAHANDSSASEVVTASAEDVGLPATSVELGHYSTAVDDADDLSNTEDAGDTEPVRVIDVIGEGKSNPVVSMYAAGIAVMFLLFGASGGGGAFLEERENETLDRLLSTQLTMDHLLLGKWFYMTCLGVVQVTVMFLWAQIVFGVDLLGHLDGFIAMTLVTASAASALGLLLATLCKSRGQLNGLSVIVILTMSAMGGSMVPRYVMSERLREFGLWTFNAWALDGYDKVFWRDLPVSSLAPQLMVLMACGVGFLGLARLLAVRWESN